MLQWYGILLGDKRLLLKTNVIVENGVLNDAWTINGIPRTQYKYSCTPRLYGSSQECYEIWQDKGIPYTMEQVTIFNTEITCIFLKIYEGSNLIGRSVVPIRALMNGFRIIPIYDNTCKLISHAHLVCIVSQESI